MSGGRVVGAEQVVASLRAFGRALPERVLKTVTEFALDVTNLAKKESPIKTGRLRRSIHMEVTQSPGRVDGIVGTNVVYAGVFEKGFKGAQQVAEFTRNQTMAWGRPINPMMVTVHPFTRNVDRPARAFLAPALAGVTPTLEDRLSADLKALV